MKLKEPLTIQTDRLPKGFTFVSRYLSIESGNITVDKGFEWDGCTCSKDNPYTFEGCCVHDALYDERVPLSNKIKDLIFYDLLKKHKFKAWGWIPFSGEIYYTGVRIFGRFPKKWFTK